MFIGIFTDKYRLSVFLSKNYYLLLQKRTRPLLAYYVGRACVFNLHLLYQNVRHKNNKRVAKHVN